MRLVTDNTDTWPGSEGPGHARPDAPPRIALYSHDTQGLGHVRRNLLIARALTCREQMPAILLLSGVREAAAFAMPPGVDCMTLPALGKDSRGGYYPRSLGVSMRELIGLRGQIIAAALDRFRPDVFIVDKVPLGAFKELEPALQSLHRNGRTRLVLGLREILDDPETVRREWSVDGFEAAIRRFYDRIWVYGDPRVYDMVREYGLAPDVAAKIRYSGYLNPFDPSLTTKRSGVRREELLRKHRLDSRRLALCVVGGGRDGLPLAEAFLQADLPADTGGLLVTGPLMPMEQRGGLQAMAERRPRTRVLEFVSDPTPLLRCADQVIAMAGYNTMCEIVSLAKQALIVPRDRPRTEQLIRAERFHGLGAVDMIHPVSLRPEALSRWLNAGPRSPRRPRRVVDLDGVAQLPVLLQEVLQVGKHGKERIHAPA
jgi:predicted glycosyltransferase